MALLIHATEVYICGIKDGVYDCILISDPQPQETKQETSEWEPSW